MNVHIEPASHADGPSLVQLLRDAGLPVEGLIEHLDTAFVARQGAAIVGCAAVEVYPDGALLRSVAVAPAARGQGLGSASDGTRHHIGAIASDTGDLSADHDSGVLLPEVRLRSDEESPGANERSAVDRIPVCVSRKRGRDGQNGKRPLRIPPAGNETVD